MRYATLNVKTVIGAATFAVGIVLTAVVFHFVLSIIYAALFDWVFGGMRKIYLIAGLIVGRQYPADRNTIYPVSA